MWTCGFHWIPVWWTIYGKGNGESNQNYHGKFRFLRDNLLIHSQYKHTHTPTLMELPLWHTVGFQLRQWTYLHTRTHTHTHTHTYTLSLHLCPPCLSLSVYLGRHWRHSRDKIYQAFPCKRSKTGRWEGLGTRLLWYCFPHWGWLVCLARSCIYCT